jgi:hypothetical protein
VFASLAIVRAEVVLLCASLDIVLAQRCRFLRASLDILHGKGSRFWCVFGNCSWKWTPNLGASLDIARAQGRRFIIASLDISRAH